MSNNSFYMSHHFDMFIGMSGKSCYLLYHSCSKCDMFMMQNLQLWGINLDFTVAYFSTENKLHNHYQVMPVGHFVGLCELVTKSRRNALYMY